MNECLFDHRDIPLWFKNEVILTSDQLTNSGHTDWARYRIKTKTKTRTKCWGVQNECFVQSIKLLKGDLFLSTHCPVIVESLLKSPSISLQSWSLADCVVHQKAGLKVNSANQDEITTQLFEVDLLLFSVMLLLFFFITFVLLETTLVCAVGGLGAAWCGV